ncbi:hypothetical protein G6F57_018807 [Rhizopus arrhizus]|nr:hypothetical protein G6F57_018807 [Rhizopus arrhizus]
MTPAPRTPAAVRRGGVRDRSPIGFGTDGEFRLPPQLQYPECAVIISADDRHDRIQDWKYGPPPDADEHGDDDGQKDQPHKCAGWHAAFDCGHAGGALEKRLDNAAGNRAGERDASSPLIGRLLADYVKGVQQTADPAGDQANDRQDDPEPLFELGDGAGGLGELRKCRGGQSEKREECKDGNEQDEIARSMAHIETP